MQDLIEKPYLKHTPHGVVTTSRVVAQHFGKEHKNVIRDIEQLLAALAEADSQLKIEPAGSNSPLNFEGTNPTETSCGNTRFDQGGVYRPAGSRFVVKPVTGRGRTYTQHDAGQAGKTSDFDQRNFQRISYLDAQGKPRPMYEMTKDGFTLLTMGFTGNKALIWKIRYIEAFNAMAAALAPGAALNGLCGDYRVLAPLFDDLHSSTRTALVLGYFIDVQPTHPDGWHKVSVRKLGKRLVFSHPQAVIYRIHELRDRGFLICKPEQPGRTTQPLLYRPDRGAIISAARRTLPQPKYEAIAARVTLQAGGVAQLQ